MKPIVADREPLLPGERLSGYPDPEGVAKLLARYGFWAFSGADGCGCGRCTIRGIEIHTSCHGGSLKWWEGWVIRIECHYLDSRLDELIPVAEEMVRQVREDFQRSVTVRFCSYQNDDKNECCYCGASPRAEEKGYLCSGCLSRPDVAGMYTLPADFQVEYQSEEVTA